jgi:mycofactocin precursor
MNAPATQPVDTEEVSSTVTDAGDTLVESELLVEEISIDGMCGVY